MNKTWTVVKFSQEDSVEAIPTTWVFGNKCYWPPFTQQKMLIAIKNHESPSTCWPSHEISFFKNGTFDNYLEARKRCKIAECQSDLLTEDDNLRNRKIRNKKVVSSTSNSEEELFPDPPLYKKKLVPLKMNEQKTGGERPTPVPSCSFRDPSDDAVLRKLVADFESFSLQSMRKQNLLTNMMADVLSEVTCLKNALKDMDMSKKSDPSNTGETLCNKLSLPAKDIEEVSELENYLTSPENFLNVVHEMSKVGGNSPFDFVKRVLLQLMTYQVASHYTWYGTKEKTAFKSTRISQMIIKASAEIGTQKKMEEALQKFFRRAKERSKFEKAKSNAVSLPPS